jgi:hypothetical protein
MPLTRFLDVDALSGLALMLVPIAVSLGFAWVWELSRYKARRYGITDRRVIVLAADGSYEEELAREPWVKAEIDGSSVWIWRHGKRVRFEGVADPHAVVSALSLEP